MLIVAVQDYATRSSTALTSLSLYLSFPLSATSAFQLANHLIHLLYGGEKKSIG